VKGHGGAVPALGAPDVAGLADVREEGKQTFYTLNQERVVACCGQLMSKFAPESETTKKIAA